MVTYDAEIKVPIGSQ